MDDEGCEQQRFGCSTLRKMVWASSSERTSVRWPGARSQYIIQPVISLLLRWPPASILWGQSSVCCVWSHLLLCMWVIWAIRYFTKAIEISWVWGISTLDKLLTSVCILFFAPHNSPRNPVFVLFPPPPKCQPGVRFKLGKLFNDMGQTTNIINWHEKPSL